MKDDTLSSTAYTETNEGIEITFSLEELKSVTGMSGVEAIKYLFHCYGCDEEFTELANEEEFITIEFPYTHKNLTESEETDPTGLSDYQKDVIKDMVQADFESGHSMDYECTLSVVCFRCTRLTPRMPARTSNATPPISRISFVRSFIFIIPFYFLSKRCA